MNIVLRMLDRWLDQDVARTNAAQACVRLLHDRRNWDDVETWLTRNPAPLDPPAQDPGSLRRHSGSR